MMRSPLTIVLFVCLSTSVLGKRTQQETGELPQQDLDLTAKQQLIKFLDEVMTAINSNDESALEELVGTDTDIRDYLEINPDHDSLDEIEVHSAVFYDPNDQYGWESFIEGLVTFTIVSDDGSSKLFFTEVTVAELEPYEWKLIRMAEHILKR
uniref:DUF4440 domain-containing protein n=1 Tax=Caenorhabditis tropicalis TaxID=1561998 RepID=A0A1I7TLA7_9PELO